MTDDDLYRAALQATTRAHPPHSGLRVGAVLQTVDGDLYPAGNIEFGSYMLTICAERAALAAAVCDGHTRFTRIGVARSDGLPISPCGACRQSLVDFAPLDVVFMTPEGLRSVSIMEMLPHAFLFDGPA